MNSNIVELENKGVLNWVDKYLSHFYSCGVLPHEIINNSYVTSSITDLVSSSMADLKEKNTINLDEVPSEIRKFLYHTDMLGVLDYVKNIEYPILKIVSDESDEDISSIRITASSEYSGGLRKSDSSTKRKLGPGYSSGIPSSRRLYK